MKKFFAIATLAVFMGGGIAFATEGGKDGKKEDKAKTEKCTKKCTKSCDKPCVKAPCDKSKCMKS